MFSFSLNIIEREYKLSKNLAIIEQIKNDNNNLRHEVNKIKEEKQYFIKENYFFPESVSSKLLGIIHPTFDKILNDCISDHKIDNIKK